MTRLHVLGIDYAYEQPLTLPNGRTRCPDFTIADDARGVTFYREDGPRGVPAGAERATVTVT